MDENKNSNTSFKHIDKMSNSELKILVFELYKENENLKNTLDQYTFTHYSDQNEQEYQDLPHEPSEYESDSYDYDQDMGNKKVKNFNIKTKEKNSKCFINENNTHTHTDADNSNHVYICNQNTKHLIQDKISRRPLSSRGRNSRVNFPADFKYKTLKVFESLNSKDATARVMGISIGTIDVWVKKKNEIFKEYLQMKEFYSNKKDNHI
jgi:hypothetical protein